MELKYKLPAGTLDRIAGSNRTFMELKFGKLQQGLITATVF